MAKGWLWIPWLSMQVYATYRYTFDTVYGSESEQQNVYQNTAREAVMSTLQANASL